MGGDEIINGLAEVGGRRRLVLWYGPGTPEDQQRDGLQLTFPAALQSIQETYGSLSDVRALCCADSIAGKCMTSSECTIQTLRSWKTAKAFHPRRRIALWWSTNSIRATRTAWVKRALLVMYFIWIACWRLTA